MKYPTVLFDLDGTLIDSGGMILESFRHATRTVLRREIPDDELVAAVGGSSIRDQMASFDADRVDELVRVYRAHNAPLHDALEAFEGVQEVLGAFPRRRAEARNRDREAPKDSRSRFRAAGYRALLRRGRHHRRHGAPQAASGARVARARVGRRDARQRGVRRRLALRHSRPGRRRESSRSVSPGGRSILPRDCSSTEPT